MKCKIYVCLMLMFGGAFGVVLPEQPYQDVFVNGEILAEGSDPDCASRYATISKVLDLYNRPITILDIGAAEGYYSFRAASDYDACAVMIGDPEWNGNVLEELCFANGQLNKVVLLSKRITVDELTRLSECEHFDVILALNVISEFGRDWKKACEAIFKLGDNIIIENSPGDDMSVYDKMLLTSINKRIAQEPHDVIGQFNGDLIWISKQRTNLLRKGYIFKTSKNIHFFEIESTYDSKTLKKLKKGVVVQESEWHPGINLMTFKCLNGTYPSIEMLLGNLDRLIAARTNDWTPHNMIINGKHIFLIDTDDPVHGKWRTYCYNKKLHQLFMDVMHATSMEEIRTLYHNAFG